jgi:DNA modification methylase
MVALLNTPELPRNTVICGDCLEEMKKMPSDSISAVICDPPYGLGEVKDIAKLLMAWMNGEDGKEYANKKGFMSKDWDVVPSPLVWKECFRVLRPGGYLLAFAGTRTWDLMSISIRLAGFEDRDTIAHNGPSALQWLYGSGFPKSTAIDKQIDKHLKAEREVIGPKIRLGDKKPYPHNPTPGNEWNERYGLKTWRDPETAPATPEAKKWQGWGSALKPSWEPVLMFRKPLSEPTIAQNVLVHGCGGLNIDATRIGTQDYTGRPSGQSVNAYEWSKKPNPMYGQITGGNPQGRWPSNTLFSHTLLCRQTGVKRVWGNTPVGHKGNSTINDYGKYNHRSEVTHGTEETVDAWECSEFCPVRILGEQSGVRSSRPGLIKKRGESDLFGKWGQCGDGVKYQDDTGTAARYFAQFSPSPDELEVPFLYASKASKRERDAGLEHLPAQQGFDKNTSKKIAHINHATGETTYSEYQPSARHNSHPTVKSLSLMKYLCRLVGVPGGVILDPFCGSGSTLCAAIYEGFSFIGIEQDASYVEIVRARIQHAMQEAGIAEVQDGEWICSDDCPVHQLTLQSKGTRAERSSGGHKRHNTGNGHGFIVNGNACESNGYDDSAGGAARFFAQFAPDSLWSMLEDEEEVR